LFILHVKYIVYLGWLIWAYQLLYTLVKLFGRVYGSLYP
jgi:hypothetical protein